MAKPVASSIEKRPEVCGGEACLGGTRIPIWLLEQARRLGVLDEQLLRSYPPLSAVLLADARAYAAAHSNEINLAIRENEVG